MNKKKIVLITGYTSEVGTSLVSALPGNEYIVYAGSRNISKTSISSKHVHLVKLDITNDLDCRKIVNKILAKEGRIDILVNIAGYSLAGVSVNFEVDDYEALLNTNAVGAFRLIKLVVPSMRKFRSGKIINVTSLCGIVALPNFGLYCSSKFALEALGKSLRYELGKDNIWVTNVAPGAIASTKLSAPMPHKTFREKFKIMSWLMPMVTSHDISKKILNLIKSSRPPGSVLMGRDVVLTSFFQKIMPTFLWDKLLFFVWLKK